MSDLEGVGEGVVGGGGGEGGGVGACLCVIVVLCVFGVFATICII